MPGDSYINFMNGCLAKTETYQCYRDHGLYVGVSHSNLGPTIVETILPIKGLFGRHAYKSIADLYGVLCIQANFLLGEEEIDDEWARPAETGLETFYGRQDGFILKGRNPIEAETMWTVTYHGFTLLSNSNLTHTMLFVQNASKLLKAKEWVYDAVYKKLINIHTGHTLFVPKGGSLYHELCRSI